MATFAGSMLGASIGLAVAAVVLLVASRSARVELDFSYRGAIVIVGVAMALVGWVVARHQSRNPIGWLFLASGVSASLNAAAEQYGVYAVVYRPGSLPAGAIVDWIGSLQWVVWIGLLGIYGFLLFPDGRPPSPRWRVVGWLAPFGMAFVVATIAIRPGTVESVAQAPNPFGIALDSSTADALITLGTIGFMGSMLVTAASLAFRFRRSRGARRQQLKWLVAAAVPVPLMVGLGGLLSGSDPSRGVAKAAQTLAIVALAGVPVGAAIGITRHRLYDIDRIINRTVVYATVTALLGAAYAGASVALAPLTGDSPVVVAGATLACAAAFRPVRARVQAAVDRRFNRSRYDAARTLEAFAWHLRTQVDLDVLVAELGAAAATTMRPEGVGVWIPERT